MKYVFDFDRTVFDMEALYAAIAATNPDVELGTVASLAGIDLSGLLFSDAIEFFKQHDRAAIEILSSGHGKTGQWDPAYQAEKVERSGIRAWVHEVHVVAKDKVTVLRDILANTDQPVVFVEDHADNVTEVATTLPEITTVYIDRVKDLAVDAAIPRIESLAELDATIGV